MGAHLEKPITEKVVEVGHNKEFLWSACSMQGWRVGMEDAHICEDVYDEDGK